MLLTGSYRRALDDKLRLAIPKPLRDQLPADSPLYLTPGLDGCVAIYPQAAFAALADRLAASSPAAREVRDYSRLFFSQATTATPDSQWRLRIRRAHRVGKAQRRGDDRRRARPHRSLGGGALGRVRRSMRRAIRAIGGGGEANVASRADLCVGRRKRRWRVRPRKKGGERRGEI